MDIDPGGIITCIKCSEDERQFLIDADGICARCKLLIKSRDTINEAKRNNPYVNYALTSASLLGLNDTDALGVLSAYLIDKLNEYEAILFEQNQRLIKAAGN